LKTQPFRVTFHDILFRIALTCQCQLSIVCPRGIPGAPGMQLPTPESPGVKIMDGVGFPSHNYRKKHSTQGIFYNIQTQISNTVHYFKEYLTGIRN